MLILECILLRLQLHVSVGVGSNYILFSYTPRVKLINSFEYSKRVVFLKKLFVEDIMLQHKRIYETNFVNDYI